jgi:putative pyruvate formate lyase activating enzyme
LGHGNETGIQELAEIMIYLQEQGCHNINLVSPSHFVPQIIEALNTARKLGLTIPIVYNSGGYDSLAELRLLEGIIDIYMPDMKYAAGEPAVNYSGAPDYPKFNQRAILEMQRQVGELKLDEQGIAHRGLLIRHLVLPHNIAGTDRILKFIAQKVSPKTHVSLMGQYFPAHQAPAHPLLNRRITREEYRQAVSIAKELGLDNVWLQEVF